MRKYASKLTKIVRQQAILYLCTAVAQMHGCIIMAKRLKCIAPVDSISGMIGKRSDFISNAAFVANVRKRGGVASKGAAFMYFSVRMRDRSTPVSTAETEWRSTFGNICTQTQANLIDPAKLPTIQAYYATNRDKYYSYYQAAWDWTRKEMSL